MYDSLVNKLTRVGSKSELVMISKYKRDEKEENANSDSYIRYAYRCYWF